jgi:hypothetical protein
MVDLPEAVAELVDDLIFAEAAFRHIGDRATADMIRDLRRSLDDLAGSYSAIACRLPWDQ